VERGVALGGEGAEILLHCALERATGKGGAGEEGGEKRRLSLSQKKKEE